MNQTGEFTENQTQEGNQTFEDNETLLNETGSTTENQTNQTEEVQPGDNRSSGSVGSGTGHSSHGDNSQDETDNESFNETNLELNESVVYNETENRSVEPIQNITPVLNLSNDTNPELDELENFTIVNETPVYIDIDELNQTYNITSGQESLVNLTTEWFTVCVFNPDNCSLTNTSVNDVIIFSLYPCGEVYTYIPQSPSLYIDCGEGWANLTDELTTNLTCNIKVLVGNENQTEVLNESTNLTILNGTVNQTVVNESKGYVCNLSTDGLVVLNEHLIIGYDGFNLTFPLEVCNLSGNVWYNESSGVLNISGIGNLTVNVTGCVKEGLPGDGVYNITCESWDEGYKEEDVYVDLDDLEDIYSDEGEGSGDSDSVSGETTGSDENSSNVSDTTQEESSDDLSEAGQEESSEVGDVSNGNETNENPETSEEEYTFQPEEGSEEGNTTINSTEGGQTNQTGSMNQTGEFTENQTQEGNQTFEDNETLLNETGSTTENQTNQTEEVQPGDNRSSGSVGSGTGHSSHGDNSQDETDNESFNETNLELNESVVYNETENRSVEPIQNITPVLNLSNDTNPELDELENFTIVNETPVYIDIDELNQTYNITSGQESLVNLTTEWFTVCVFNPDNCSLTNTSVNDVIIFSLYPCGEVYTYIPQSPSLYIDCGEGWANLTDELTTNLTCNIKVLVGNENQTEVLNESTNLTILNGTVNQTVVNESKGYVCNLSTDGLVVLNEHLIIGYDGFNLTFPLEVCNLSGNVWYNESSGVLNISGIGNLTVNVTGCVKEGLPGDGVYNITCESAVDRELIGYLSNMTNGKVKILDKYNITITGRNTTFEGGSQVNESISVYDISMMLNDSGVIFYGFRGVGINLTTGV